MKHALEKMLRALHFKVHAVYEPDPSQLFGDCYMAAVELFAVGQTYRLYFKVDEQNQIDVQHIERWYFG